ncbi:MAG: DNA polymerase III subunit delta' [Candidatus Aminicenantes bacterium]|nr:DNA polymerase III subunit delta' [Candidatus Aminicenantes bacterium]
MAFKDIEGNERAKRILKLALERERLPNSLLFAGPEGVGKRRTALTLAKALNCRQLTADSCDACEACRAIEDGRFPDVMEIVAPAKEITIEQVRLLKQMAALRPLAGKRRVFILVDAENVNPASANSLLKVLEEPPPRSHIILLTASPFLLLPTIRSRCRTLSFAAMASEELERILRDRGFREDQARILALLGGGSLRRALELDWDEIQERKERAWILFEALLSGDGASLFLDAFGTLPKSALEEFRETLELFSSFARDLLLLGLGGDARLLLNPDLEDRLRASGRFSAPRLLAVLAEFDLALAELPRNLNKSLLAAALFSNIGEIRNV